MIDPHPQMPLEYALKLLRLEYGAENVGYWRVRDRIGIFAQHPGQGTVSVTLTVEQAKYLAAHPLSVQDLAVGMYPAEWPADDS